MSLIASVIIPTYNKVERLELVLESFRFQSEAPENFELVIVDDGSTDGTENLINRVDAEFKINYIKQNNSGRSCARNTGIKAAKSKIVIFCDDDCIVSKDFIKAHLDAHRKNKDCVVHGRINTLPYLKFFKNPTTGEIYDDEMNRGISELTALNQYLLKLSDMKDLIKVNEQKKLTFLEKQIRTIFKMNLTELMWLGCTGGNFSCPVDLLVKVGLFDEILDQRWGAEDLELGYRLYKYGVNFMFCEEGCNYHIAHLRKDYEEDLRFSINKFYEKHKDNLIKNLPMLLLKEVKNVEEYLKICKYGKVGV